MRALCKGLLAVICCGAVISNAAAAIEENFEAYPLTSDWAGGVGGWRAMTTGDADAVEIAATGIAGSRALRMNDPTTGSPDRLAFWEKTLTPAVHTAVWHVNVASVVNSSAIVELRINKTSDLNLASVRFLGDGTVIRLVGDGGGGSNAEVLAASYTTGQWYQVELQADFGLAKYRVRLDGGAWSSFASFVSDRTATESINDLFFVRNADASFDNFSHVPEPAGAVVLLAGTMMALRRRSIV